MSDVTAQSLEASVEPTPAKKAAGKSSAKQPAKPKKAAKPKKGELVQQKIDFSGWSKAKPKQGDGSESKKRKRDSETTPVPLEEIRTADEPEEVLPEEDEPETPAIAPEEDEKAEDVEEEAVEEKELVVTVESTILDFMTEEEVDKLLRGFDLDVTFGPCVGITRLERWERATMLGLDPPSVVKEVVDADVENLNQPLWHGQPF